MTDSEIRRCVMNDIDMHSTNLSGADLDLSLMKDILFAYTKLDGTKITNVFLQTPNVHGIDFAKAIIENSVISTLK
jgi:uncharacterized protein YjbI with pentapeptide repeats